MIFWAVLAVMTVAAVGLLMPALLRRSSDAPPRAEYDLRVYRDQLAEIERDAERGLIDPDQAAAARTEIGRRLIAAGEAAAAPDGGNAAVAPKRSNRVVAALVAVLVPGIAVAIYAQLGDPELALHGPTVQTAGETGHDSGPDMNALVTKLGDRLQARPNDATGWALYARSLAGLGRFAEAEPAFERAITLNPNDADLVARDAEAQIFLADGTVTPAARKMLDRALALNPAEPRARYYLGLADREAGHLHKALNRWIALEADSPADAPWRKPLAARIAETAKAVGIDAGQLAAMRREAAARAPVRPPAVAATPSPAMPGPTAADVAAAQKMSPQDRMAMIRTMVQRLADKMKANPNDAAGWLRLGRAYQVLGEADKAKEALAKAAALQGTNGNSATETPAPAGPQASPSAPGPTAADVAAAQKMSPEDRMTMIRGMVQRLADKMKANPNDAAGWQRLGRAYQVLGEADKAEEAFAKATALQGKQGIEPNSRRPTVDQIEAAQKLSEKQRTEMVRSMVARLAERMKTRPDDAAGWVQLGRSYDVLNEPEKSRDAWAKAAALEPKNKAVLVAYAEAIAAATPRGAPVPRALGPLSERILAIDPKQPGALWYSGLVKEAAGDKAGARERWTRLLTLLDPGSSERAALQKRIDALDAPAAR